MLRARVLEMSGEEVASAVRSKMVANAYPFYPDLDAAHDYRVLQHVRTLDGDVICRVRDIVRDYIWDSRAWDLRAADGLHDGRTICGCTQYLPGDWALAFLLALCDDPPEPGCGILLSPMIQRTSTTPAEE